MRETDREKQYKIPTSILLSLLLLSLVLLTVQMLSRYVSGGNGEGSARVAKFHVTSDLNTFQQTFTVELEPGKNKEYSFKIKNDSETALKLQMDVHGSGNLPLKIAYHEDAVGSVAETTLIENILDKQSASWTASMEAGEKSKSYTITMDWPADRNGLTYAGGVSTIELKITAEQTD